MIRLYLKIPEKFVRLILQDGCMDGNIPLIPMVKFHFLAQFPVDQLPLPVVSSLIHFCANLQHSLVKLYFVSTLSLQNPYLLFCYINASTLSSRLACPSPPSFLAT